MARFILVIPGEMSSETAEEIEDALAKSLQYMGFEGLIKDDVTGNTTMFPNDNIDSIPRLLNDVVGAITGEGWGDIRCPECGGDQIYTAEDDDEMRECATCGHTWEIEDDSQAE